MDAGKVADPIARSEDDGPRSMTTTRWRRCLSSGRMGRCWAFSLGDIGVDDPNQFYYRVATNNGPGTIFVERVTGLDPDPNGMARVQVIDGEPARAKGRFGRCDAERVLVQFEYLFETAEATEIVVYLSDVPDLLDHDDPLAKISTMSRSAGYLPRRRAVPARSAVDASASSRNGRSSRGWT